MVFWKEPEVIVDISRYFTQAKYLEIYGIKYFISEWGKEIKAWTDLPLIPFFYGLIFKFFGETRTYIQIFTTSLFSMTVILTFFIGKALWDEHTGVFAGLMLMGIPYIFSQVPLMLVDVATMFFITLSVFTCIKALKEGGIWIIYSSVAIFCTVFSKYSTWLMLSVLAVIFLIYLLKGDKHESRYSIIKRGVLVAFISMAFIGVMLIFKFDLIFRQIEFLREYQMPGLKRWGESFISTYFYQIHPFITIAALFSVYEALRKRDLKFLIVSWMVLLIVLFQIKRARYAMITFPMFTLMASYGIQRIKSLEIKKCITSCIVASSITIAIFAYLPFLQSLSLANLMNAGKALDSLEIEKIEVFTIQSKRSIVNTAIAVPILDLFTKKDICYHYESEIVFSPEVIKKSSLRFTWEYKNPQYYTLCRDDSKEDSAIVVISNSTFKTLPEYIKQKLKGYQEYKTFKTSTGVFRYSPVVIIFLPYKGVS
jgi:hypothetical protein